MGILKMLVTHQALHRCGHIDSGMVRSWRQTEITVIVCLQLHIHPWIPSHEALPLSRPKTRYGKSMKKQINVVYFVIVTNSKWANETTQHLSTMYTDNRCCNKKKTVMLHNNAGRIAFIQSLMPVNGESSRSCSS